MNYFRMRADGTVVSEREYRDMFPNTLLPATLVPEDADVILNSPQPEVTRLQYVSASAPVQDELDNWVQGWQINEHSQEYLDNVLLETRASYIKQLEDQVDNIRDTCIGKKATEYQSAEQQARAYKAAGYTGAAGNKVVSWAAAKYRLNWTLTQAAEDIITQADSWIYAEDTIRANRLYFKEDLRSATTHEALVAAWEGWSAFNTQIRTALKI